MAACLPMLGLALRVAITHELTPQTISQNNGCRSGAINKSFGLAAVGAAASGGVSGSLLHSARVEMEP